MKRSLTAPMIIASIYSVFVWLLIPFARVLQAKATQLITPYPWVWGSCGALLIIMILVRYYLTLITRIGWWPVLWQGLSLGVLLIASIIIADDMYVEYTHLPLFAVCYMLWRQAFTNGVKQRLVSAALICTNLVSLIDELLQGLHPERFFDVRDLAINLIGSLLGCLLYELWVSSLSRLEP